MTILFAAAHESGDGPYRRNPAFAKCRLLGLDRNWSISGRTHAIDPGDVSRRPGDDT
jgi:hypothetical protein